MQTAKAYILNNLDQPITIARIAGTIHQSKSSLKRKFIATYGYTVYEFIQYERIKKATILFRTGDYKITEAANAVGYTNIFHFSKAFCKHVGCKPKEYLKALGLS